MKERDDYFSISDGMPTGPDVEAICKEYPDLAIGSKLPRADLYKLLGLDSETQRGYNRLRSVMTAFAHKMRRDRGFVVDYDADRKQYRICTVADVLEKTPGELERIKRQARRARRNLVTVAPEASEAERPIVEHRARMFQVMEREARKS